MAKKTKKDYLTEEEYNARRLRSAAATGKDGSTYTTGGKATTSYEDYKNYVNSQENEEYWEEHSGTYEPGYGSDPAKAARKNEADARLSTRSRLHSNNPRSKYSGDSDFTHSVRAKKAKEAQEKLEKKRESKDTKFGIKFNDRTDEGFRNSKGQTFGEWLTEIKETGNTPEGLEPLRSDEEVYSIQVNRLVNNLGNWLETDFPDRHNVESNYAMYSREIQRQLEASERFAEKYKDDPQMRTAFENTTKVLTSLQNELNYAANTRKATLKDLTIGSAQRGSIEAKYGQELYKQMMGQENEAEKYAKMLESDKFNFDSGFIGDAISGGMSFVGQHYAMFTDPETLRLTATMAGTGAATGAAIGGTAGVTAGSVVPGAGNLLGGTAGYLTGGTAGMVAGGVGGFKMGSAQVAFEMEAGFAYKEMTDNGINPALAKKIALTVGGINAGLEFAQVGVLTDAFKLTKKAGATSTAGKIAQELAARGIDVGKETMQEVAQEATTIIGSQAASKIQNDKWQYSADEISDRLADTALQSALAFGVMNVPAGAVNTGRIINQGNRDLDFIGRYVKSEDAVDTLNYAMQRINEEEPEGDMNNGVAALAVAKKINGEELSPTEEYHISQSPTAQKILEESAAGTLRTGKGIDNLITSAMKSKDEKTVKLAKNLSAKRDSGQKLSEREIGKLYSFYHKITPQEFRKKGPVIEKKIEKTSEAIQETPIETKANISRAEKASKIDVSENRTKVIVPDQLSGTRTSELKSISIKDDGTFVRLSDGETVNIEDVHVDKGVKQVIDDFAHYDSKLANQAVMSYVTAPQETKEVQSPTTFSRQFSLAIEYARLGRPIEFAAKSDSINTLSEAQLQTAYNIGRSLSSVSAKQKFIDDSRVLGQRRQGSFSVNGVKLSNLKRTLSEKGYETVQKEIKLIEALAETTGLKIVLEESVAKENGRFMGANGWMDPDGTIHLDVNALRDTTSDENSMMLYTLSHELTHLAKVYSPQMWKEYSDFMVSVMEENGESIESLIQAKKDEYAAIGQRLTNDEALEEVIAQGSQMCLTNSSLLERMAWENMTLFQKFKEWVLGFIEDIKRTYRTYEKNLGREADAVIDRLDEVAARFEELQIDAIRALNETPPELDNKMIGEVKDENGEPMFQLRTMLQDIDKYMDDLRKIVYLDDDNNVIKDEEYKLKDGKIYYNKKGKAVKQKVARRVYNDEEIEKLRRGIFRIMETVAKNIDILDYNHDMDRSNRPFSPVKQNGDPHYKAALDFSTLCRKRLLQQTVIESLQQKLGMAIGAAEQVAIREELDKMRENYKKIQVACALCYVEAARLATPQYTNEFFSIKVTREDGTVEFVESLEKLNAEEEKSKSKIVETTNVRERALIEYFALKSKWFANEKKKITQEMFGEDDLSKDEIKNRAFEVLMGQKQAKLNAPERIAEFKEEAAKIRKNKKTPEDIEKALKREARHVANLIEDDFYQATVARRADYALPKDKNDTFDRMSEEEKAIVAESANIPKEQFLSANGLASLSLNHPEVYDAFITFVRNKARSKALEGRVPYVRGDLFNTKNRDGSRVASNSLLIAMNLESGFRHQSWSDFEPQHILDLIAAIIDFSTVELTHKETNEKGETIKSYKTRGIKAHAYTKVPDMVRVCGLTNMMLNMSLIPTETGFRKGADLSHPEKLTVADLAFNSIEGMPYEIMLELRDMFPETAGNIAIGMSERQMELLMESDEIDYIIPYHHSGLPKELANRMSLGEWTSFQDYQNPTVKKKKDDDSNEKPKEAKGPALREWFDEEKAKDATDGKAFMREASKKYIELCNERNIVPPFPQLLKEVNGNYELKDENSNYWKVLIDRKMVNQKTNKVIIQKVVQPKFNIDAIINVLDQAVENDAREENEKAANEIITKILNGKVDVGKSVTDRVNALDEEGKLDRRLNSAAKTLLNDPLISAILPRDFVTMSAETGNIEVFARPDEYEEDQLKEFISKNKKKTGFTLTIHDHNGDDVFSMTWGKGTGWGVIKSVLYNYYNKGEIPPNAVKAPRHESGPSEGAKQQVRTSDAAYMKAVEEKNMRIAQKLVDEAAKEAGYTTPKLYHGTPHFGFTEFKDPSNEVPFIYTSTKREVSARYAGDQNYAFVRPIGRKYRTGDSTEDIIENAKWVEGLDLHVMSPEEKEKEYEKTRKELERIGDKMEELLQAIDDVDWSDEMQNAESMVRSVFYEGMSVDEQYNFKEDDGYREQWRKDFKWSLDAFRNNINIVRDYVSDNYEKLKGAEKEYLDYITSYEFIDAGFNAVGMYLAATDDDILMDGRGDMYRPANLKERMDYTNNIGSYKLYGNLGDKPFEFDADGAQFWGMKVPEIGDDYYSTDTISKWAYDNGYTSVIMRNIYDGGDKADNYVFFNSKQVKSADPVVYDDNGNVIPLSERFSDSTDIRYQLRNYEIDERDEFAEAMETYAKTPADKRVLSEYRRRLNEYIKLRQYKDSVDEQLVATGQTSERERLKRDLKKAEEKIRELDAALFRMESSSQPVKDILHQQQVEITEEVTKREREIRERMVQNEIDKRRRQISDFRAHVKDKEAKTKLRAHIKKKVKRLDDMVRHYTNTRHIPDDLLGAVIDFCEVFTDNNSIFSKSKLNDIKVAYDTLRPKGEYNDYDAAGAYDEGISQDLFDLRKTMAGKRLSDLTVSELTKVKDIVDNLMFMVNEENGAFYHGQREKVKALAEEEMEYANSKKNRAVPGFLNTPAAKFIGIQNLTPPTVFDNLGPVFKGFFDDMTEASNEWGLRIKESRAKLEKINKKYDFFDWAENNKKRKNRKRFPMTTEHGDKISLTIDEAMGLYATWKRDIAEGREGEGHLSVGGFVFQDAVKEKRAKGVITVEVETKEAHPLTKKDMAFIANEILGKKQREYVDAVVEYMSTEMAALGNEASRLMHGFEKFKVEYYYPYKSSEMYLKTELESPDGTPMIKGIGFSKRTEPKANNPIVARDFSEVCEEHISQMAYYRYMAPVQDSFMRVFNYKNEEGKTLKSIITTTYGEGVTQYIEQFMRDIYGGVRMDMSEAAMDKVISLFKQNAVMLSASVVIQQMTSLPRAFAYIDPKYFIGVSAGKKSYEEMCEHSGIAVIKSIGRFDVYTSRSTSSWLMKRHYKGLSKVKGALTDREYRNDLMALAPQKADELAWTMLWNAVKKETLHTTNLKKGSDEFFAHVTKRFNNIVNHTQVYDSVFVRSQNMRSKSPLMKMMTAFMSEPTVYLNMAYNALKNGKAFKVAGVLIFAIILNDLAKSLVYAGRDGGDDDDDKTYVEKYLAEIVGNFKEDINPLTYVPFLRDIWSTWSGYDVQRNDMDVVSDIMDRFKLAIDSDASLTDRLTAAAEAIGIATGVPVKNVRRDIDTTINIIFRMPAIDKTTPDGIKLAILQELRKSYTDPEDYDAMAEAFMAGDMETYNELREKAKWQLLAQNDENSEYDTTDADEAIERALEKRIQGSFTSGEINTSKAEALLVKSGADEDDAYFTVEKWAYENTHDDEYSKYDKLRAAVRAGKDIDKAKKELMSHGVKEENIDKQISEEFNNIMKEKYYPAFDKAIADKDVQRYYEERQKMGNYRKEILGESDDEVGKWLKRCTYEGIRLAYEGGDISFSEAVSMLQGLHGDSYKSANRIVNGW